MKTIEENFTDWEASAFGFGYGTGEEHILPALKSFFSAFGNHDDRNAYDYEALEAVVTPTVAWLIINVLGHADIIEYGTSPRYGWLTPHGERLKAFIDSKSAEELYELTCRDENYHHCSPDACNCGPAGYQEGVDCPNPFWPRRGPST